jgi:hypothetical protein
MYALHRQSLTTLASQFPEVCFTPQAGFQVFTDHPIHAQHRQVIIDRGFSFHVKEDQSSLDRIPSVQVLSIHFMRISSLLKFHHVLQASFSNLS